MLHVSIHTGALTALMLGTRDEQCVFAGLSAAGLEFRSRPGLVNEWRSLGLQVNALNQIEHRSIRSHPQLGCLRTVAQYRINYDPVPGAPVFVKWGAIPDTNAVELFCCNAEGRPARQGSLLRLSDGIVWLYSYINPALGFTLTENRALPLL